MMKTKIIKTAISEIVKIQGVNKIIYDKATNYLSLFSGGGVGSDDLFKIEMILKKWSVNYGIVM